MMITSVMVDIESDDCYNKCSTSSFAIISGPHLALSGSVTAAS